MPKPVKQRRSTDENEMVFDLVRRSTKEEPEKSSNVGRSAISEYMSQIGRKGGKIGGKRRMETMTPEERSRIALKAARASWAKRKRKKA